MRFDLEANVRLQTAKALELFMQSLIDQACQEARQRNAKRLTPAHL